MIRRIAFGAAAVVVCSALYVSGMAAIALLAWSVED